MKSRLVALTVMFAGLAMGLASPPGVAVFAVLLPLVALAIGPRLDMDRLAQAGLTIGAMVLGVLVPRLGYGPPTQDQAILDERALLLGMPMLGVAVARAVVKRPAFGDPLTLTAALVALTAAGRAHGGLAYPLLATAAVAAGLAALWGGDAGRPAFRKLGSRHVAGGAIAALAGLSLAVLASLTLPLIHEAMIGRIMARFQQSQTGIDDDMKLGSLAGMLESDEVVMRVRGRPPQLVADSTGPPDELLRGVVLTSYGGSYWSRGFDEPWEVVPETDREPPPDAGFIEIEHAGTPKRHFLPLGADGVIVSAGVYERDPFRLAKPSGVANLASKRVWFQSGGGPDPIPPRTTDSGLTRPMRRKLDALLAEWRIGEQPPRERVLLIEAHLRKNYAYSLTFDRTAGVDPVLDFLTVHPEGHCEYFASALALLGRASGVPTRIVSGYRVTEESPFGYHIVRERNAHSWVEAYVDGRWETFDPTPPSDLAAASRRNTALFGALMDGLATGWEAVDDWLAERSAFELSLMLVALFGVLIIGRALRNRRTRALGPSAPLDPPLPAFLELERALARRGLARRSDETLACFAARIDASDLEAGARTTAALTVRAYAALRYAAHGDEQEVQRALGDSARALA